VSDPSIAAERVGRYQLLEPIGAGPNGAVARGKVFGVAGLERQFAIKRFHPELTVLAPMAQAISAAARAYGTLEHPRIAKLAELGVAGGETFTAVEFVSGLDALRLAIEARAAGTTLPVGGALGLVSSAARAVGYAHGRGLCHLGLSPSNVIVTVEGDVKVTDFGILAATIGSSPTEQPRLDRRIGYLAPEQLAGEATSTATDVYALGVIAYELVTGQPAFAGGSSAEIAAAVLAGPPRDPMLPRPIVRVLQRCLARSPFERFPDARALADALDAAMRVAPVPGTRRDVGAHVKASLDRIAALNEGNLSGMLSLPLGPGEVGHEDVSTTDFVRPDVPVPGPTPLVGPRDVSAGSTMTELAKPAATMAGVPPPPIPVPRGVASGSSPPAQPATPAIGQTMMGMPPVRKNPSVPIPTIPSVRSKPPTDPNAGTPRPKLATPAGPAPVAGAPAATPPVPAARPPATPLRRPTPPAMPAPGAMPAPPSAAPAPGATPAPVPAAPAPVAPAPSAPPMAARPPAAPADHERSETIPDSRPESEGDAHEAARTGPRLYDLTTNEMPPLLASTLATATARPTEEVDALVAQAYATDPEVGFPDERHASSRAPLPVEPPPAAEPTSAPSPAASASQPAMASDPRATAFGASPALPFGAKRPSERSPWPMVVLGVATLGAFGALGYFTYVVMSSHSKHTAVAQRHAAPAAAHVVASAAPTKPAHPAASATPPAPAPAAAGSGSAAAAAGSAAAPTPVPAAPAHVPAPAAGSDDASAANHVTPPAATPVAGGGALEITSTPAGARVFLDGADQGATPLKLPGTGDQHTLALYLPGHALYLGSIAGHGRYELTLDDVPFPRGDAGLKVIDCKDEHRYYIYLDGHPTGRTCPSGRIHLTLGTHTVELYDLATETRKSFTIDATQTSSSYRIKVE
jgi:serine/threonine-protein kinase